LSELEILEVDGAIIFSANNLFEPISSEEESLNRFKKSTLSLFS
jgi:hypothetical protein